MGGPAEEGPGGGGHARQCCKMSTQKEGNGRTPEQGWSCAGIRPGGGVVHARRALEGEAVAPGSEMTWKALTDEAKSRGPQERASVKS